MPTIAGIVALTFTMLILAPTAAAVSNKTTVQFQQKALTEKVPLDDRYSQILIAMEQQFILAERLVREQKENELALKADMKNAFTNGGDFIVRKDDWKKALNKALELFNESASLHTIVEKNFEQEANKLKKQGLSKIILNRHYQAHESYTKRQSQFAALVKNVIVSKDEKQAEALTEVVKFLDKYSSRTPRMENDYDQLPFSTSEDKQVRLPVRKLIKN